MTPRHRRIGAAVLAATLGLGGSALTEGAASATPPTSGYTITAGAKGVWTTPSDTPAFPYIDKDGTFYFQQAAALYGATERRHWDFHSGTNFDTATLNSTLSNAVNPANSKDRNNDTTWRCNNSPTGLEATPAPAGSSYSQPNYCDLVGVWVDPDTGDWYGLVHNEFTPKPFGDYSHYDAIDYAVSTDQGRTWTIEDHVITSPYSTARADTAAFPHQTYHYGAGDPRLFVDTASGYFYVFYGSRIIDKSGGWKAFHEHVARAPIASKMAPDSWQKWYDGAWSQPGRGGKESNMVPVGATSTTGYTPASAEYDPANTGTTDQQVAAGKMPATSPLFVMDITYNAHLGLYIGEPQAVDQSGDAPQQYYATDDLTTQKWYPIGDTDEYRTASWYRWFLDGVSKTGSGIVGKDFRTYCSHGCSNKSSAEYVNVTIDHATPAAPPVNVSRSYRIAGGNGRVLAQEAGSPATTSLPAATGSGRESWTFTGNGDGSYRIANAGTGHLLGVDSTATAGRAWGAKPTVTAAPAGGPTVGQQWWVIPGKSTTNAPTGTHRLVNRYSGLVIGLSSDTSRLAETTPTRTWSNSTGNTVGGTRNAAEQTLTLTATGSAPELVSVTDPGSQSTKVNTAVSLQLTATDSLGKPLTFSATGLPGGLSITSTGLISGTPTTTGTSTATVTATSGTATGTRSLTWSVVPVLDGTHTVVTSGKALDDPNHSRVTGTPLITWSTNGGANQNWVFTRQTDGSYRIVNGLSNLCMDVSGGSTTAGARVIQATCADTSSQRWLVTPATGGASRITSQKSSLLLTTASTTNGAQVTQQADNGSALQRWTIN
ncbi:RICIN domain-containing protein [Kitasatospora sp. NPDC054939]